MTNFAPRKDISEAEIAETIQAILDAATLPEKVEMMSGRGFVESYARTGRWCAEPYRAGGGCERLGVPALFFSDGPRGVCAGHSTCFPVPMARGATFDVDLERRIGAGMEGGAALADLLFGVISPSAKLPFTVARDARDYPFFDPEADRIDYGPWHGYTLMEREGRHPRFAFGHGLSYARFGYRALKARRAGERIEVAVSVANRGAMAADEVVQFYVAPPGRVAERPRKLLKAFARVTLAPGETKTVRRSIRLSDLTWWSPTRRDWLLETGTHHILAGPSSRDEDLLSAALEL